MSPESQSGPESLLVVRLGAMGDVIHTMAAVTALRTGFPATRIGWAIEERWAALLSTPGSALSGPRNSARPLVDVVYTLDTKKWRKSLLAAKTRDQVSTAFKDIRGQNYAIVGDFQGALKSAVISRLAGSREIVGFAEPRESPARFFYGKKVKASGHVIEQYHALAEAIAGSRLPISPPLLPCDPKAEESIKANLPIEQRNIVILNPGAGWVTKQWPVERYAEVARVLASEGMFPVVNFGPGEEDLARSAAKPSEGRAVTISCSISELIALTRRARLFIGGDTGPLHLAAALKVPTVALFGPTDPARNGPYGTRSIVLRSSASVTSLSHTSGPDTGLLQITSDQVLHAARQLLQEANA